MRLRVFVQLGAYFKGKRAIVEAGAKEKNSIWKKEKVYPHMGVPNTPAKRLEKVAKNGKRAAA